MPTKPKEHLKKQIAPQAKEKNNPAEPKLTSEFASLERASRISNYYGFSRLPALTVTKNDLQSAKSINLVDQNPFFQALHPEEMITILNAQSRKELNHLPQPLLTFYESRLVHEGHGKNLENTLTIDVIGSTSPLAEAALIHIVKIILSEEGVSDINVELTSVGDRESMSRFNRELSSFYKKIGSDLPATLKNILKKDTVALLTCPDPEAALINADAPQSVSCLSDLSCTHFKAVLEYLEQLDISYEINPLLIPDRSVATETVFRVQGANQKNTKAPYAVGYRYNGLSKKIGLKRDMPACRVVIVLPKTKMELLKAPTKKTKTPPFYFVQIGTEAKLRSLQVIEMLRKAKISLSYGLIKDKLIGQLTAAEQMHTSYVLIMGQRECMENSVLVRNMENSSQESVDIDNLVAYLKKLEK